MIATFWREYPLLPPINQIFMIVLYIILFSYIILSSIFIYKNRLDKSKQVQLKCAVISIAFFLYFLSNTIYFYVLLLPHWSHIGNGGVAMYSYLIYAYLTFAILFANATFTVTKFSDILSFDIMISKNRFFLILTYLYQLGPMFWIAGIILSSSTMYYN